MMLSINSNKASLLLYVWLVLQYGFMLGPVLNDLLPQCLHLSE